jgi:CHAT domain-containing protein
LPNKEIIDAAANQLLSLLDKPAITREQEDQLQTAVNKLSSMILEPLSEKLPASRLIVVADGTLQYVPFQMLKASPTAAEPLVAKLEIVDAPSASALLAVREERRNRRPGPKTLVGFGDAVFSADYSPGANRANTGSRSDQNSNSRQLPRLFNAKRELRAIGDVVGSESAFYTEYNATRENLLHLDLSQFRIVHVVTHGILDDDHPELSGLFLSLVDANGRPQNGFVALADVYRMRAPVDLVVLSACRTALGQELQGEGLIGLTRGFMYAGASSVLASLWKVDDAATAELMKHFYTNLLRDGLTPPAALRAAQNHIRSQSQWQSPYYWAGFTLQGDYDLHLKTSTPSSHRFEKLIAVAALSLLVVAIVFWYARRRNYSMSK